MFGNLSKTMVGNRTSLSFLIQMFLFKSILYTNQCPRCSFILVQAFYITIHVCRSFVNRLSSRFTRSWFSQYSLTDKSMLMLISKLFFTYFHRIVNEKKLPTRLRKKTEGSPNNSESSYQQNSSLRSD